MFKRSMPSFFIIGLSISLLVSSCANPPPQTDSHAPTQFYVAIPILASQLLSQVQAKSSLFSGKQNIVIDPFVYADSGEVIKASRNIEQGIIKEAQKNFEKLTVRRMDQQNINEADYVMLGVILFEPLKGAGGQGRKYYHIASSVMERKTGTVAAKSEVWVSDSNLDSSSVVADAPVIPTDPKKLEELLRWTKLPIDAQIPKGFSTSLDTKAILAQAETAAENGNYKDALFLFGKASQRPEGQILKTYVGLYSANVKLGDLASAGEAFGKLVMVGVRDKNLSVKFLFEVNDTAFINQPEKRQEYSMWLQQIGQYFNSSQECLHIIGHSSKTGEEDYNKKLSLARAEKIHQLLGIGSRAKAFGKGYEECVNCLGSDDNKDAVDRRVVFKVVNCSEV